MPRKYWVGKYWSKNVTLRQYHKNLVNLVSSSSNEEEKLILSAGKAKNFARRLKMTQRGQGKEQLEFTNQWRQTWFTITEINDYLKSVNKKILKQYLDEG